MLHRTADLLSFPPNNPDTLARLVAIAAEAGGIALGFFKDGGKTSAGVEWKGDGSPVTEADYAVNAYLEPQLKSLWPGAAWLSEESADDEARLGARHLIVVDPIDGTRGFARGDRHWAISVALVENNRPTMGVVHAPALEQTFAARQGGGARLNDATLRVAENADVRADMRVTCPNNLAKAMRDAGVRFDFQPRIASLALRVVMVAAGTYTAGYTLQNSHDWDLAAADLVLQEAGGLLADLDGQALIYNKREPSHGVLTATPRAMQLAFREALAKTPFG